MGTQRPARHARRERALSGLAARQHGVLSRRQLLDAGLSVRTIKRRVEAGRLGLVHRGVYSYGVVRLTARGEWMAAVLAGDEGAVLSHRNAAALWGLMRPPRGVVEISARRGRRRPCLIVHECGVGPDDRTVVDGIPVTTVARTLFDVAEVVDERRAELAFEEADRLGLAADAGG